jgi:hypothetical protein
MAYCLHGKEIHIMGNKLFIIQSANCVELWVMPLSDIYAMRLSSYINLSILYAVLNNFSPLLISCYAYMSWKTEPIHAEGLDTRKSARGRRNISVYHDSGLLIVPFVYDSHMFPLCHTWIQVGTFISTLFSILFFCPIIRGSYYNHHRHSIKLFWVTIIMFSVKYCTW